MWLVAGLGNPGKRYSFTRHNVGFMAADALAQELRVTFSRKFDSEVAQTKAGGEKVVIAKPLSYMNRSGEPLIQLLNFFKIESQKFLVVYDDFNLDLGVLRLRLRGSAGGHNGVQSIIDILGSHDFPRLRIGIGKPQGETADFVLTPFAKAEKPLIQESISRSVNIVSAVLRDGLEKTVSRYKDMARK